MRDVITHEDAESTGSRCRLSYHSTHMFDISTQRCERLFGQLMCLVSSYARQKWLHHRARPSNATLAQIRLFKLSASDRNRTDDFDWVAFAGPRPQPPLAQRFSAESPHAVDAVSGRIQTRGSRG